jgi:sigma-B regulation protein RsbU (phosphoserine phosphatase)
MMMNPDQADSCKGDVLIVDDTPANLRLLSQMLAEQGYHVRPVPDGALALAAIQAELPDIILLDIRMPGMNGYEVCEHLKENAHTRDIPVIFISALDATQDKVRAFAAGGEDYVTKPFHVEEVLARVGTHLALRKVQKQLQEANRKMAQELALAGEVQFSFLPQDLPELPGWQIAATLRPAREMSGDFYDIISLPDGCSGFVVADVCDKGAGAALYMALSWSLIRTYAAEFPAQPANVLRHVNRRIVKDIDTNRFVTTFYGTLDPATGTLLYCNAGHCEPYLVSAPGSENIRGLDRTGVPLGIFAEETWEQRSIQLVPGDMLVIYTDGIIEAQNAQGAFLGKDRLLQAAGDHFGLPAWEVRDAILADVLGFEGETPQADDIALIILRWDTLAAA